MQDYELTILITPELDEKALEEFFKNLEGTVAEDNKVLKSEPPKKIKLSYPIQKKQEAFLASHEFQTEVQKIGELKTKIEKNPEILRFLLIKKEKVLKKEPPAKKPLKTPERKKAPVKEKVELKKIEKDLEKILDFTHEGKPKGEA